VTVQSALIRFKRSAVLIVSIALVSMALAGCSPNEAADEGSYTPARAGDQDSTFVEMLKQQYGITMDSDAAVDIARAACEAPVAGVGLYNTQRSLQQRYPDYSLDTVARVMGAGVLAYCPERLP
jgi:hypothetical protein